jgi:hypothetical protein
MYLGTGDIIALLIALLSALIVLGLSIKEHARLTKENSRLRFRIRELNKQVEIYE